MSLFNSVELTCPACRAAVAFRVVHSVNAVRAPELRRAILDQTFQRATCSSCALDFRYAPEFTYVDSQRGQWVAALPLDRLRGWREAELSAPAPSKGSTARRPLLCCRRSAGGCARESRSAGPVCARSC